jgi:hypothetical protein
MAQVATEFLPRGLNRWARPDAHHFVRSDWRRSVAPGSDAAAVFDIYEQKYRPDQARVPAGSSEGGRWTAEGARTRTVEGLPPAKRLRPILAGLPMIPRKRPPTSPERTAIAKAVAIALVEAGANASGLIEKVKQASWLYHAWPTIVSYMDAPKSLGELQQNALTARPGYDRHHVVEQTAAAQIGYPRRMIDAPENIVSIPRMKHWEINAWYRLENEEFGRLTPREYLSGKDWDERQRVGLIALRKFGVLKQ